MSYLGRVTNKPSDIRVFDVTGSTSATHTLTWTAPNEQSLIVTINGVKQHEDAYSVSGVTLTLTSALVSTDKLEVVGINDIGTTITPAQGSVNTAQLATDAVSTVKIADDSVTDAKLANSINTDIAANTAKVTNATHTGDVTGATALTIAADAVTTAKIVDDAVTAAKLADSAYLANRNRIINGNFDVWQRGTSFASQTAEAYFADRWKVKPATGCTMTVSRQAFTIGQTDVPYEPTYFLRADITTAGSANAEIMQKIEDVRTFAGQTIAVSFWAKSIAGTQTLTCRTIQEFGSGGSANVVSGGTTAVLTSSWQKVTFSVAIASISGKTIGSGSAFSFNFYWPNSSTSNDVDLAQVQVEAGSAYTPFEYKTYGQELEACQRYYTRLTSPNPANATFGFGTAATSSRMTTQFNLPTTMRTTPTTGYGGTLSVLFGTFRNNITSSPDSQLAPQGGYVNYDVSGTPFTAYTYSGLIGANNDTSTYVEFIAEL